jgi:hypothetical protein
MHAVIRTYQNAGSKKLFDVLEERKADVEATLRAVPGLVSYTLLRTSDGGMSITVCQDKAGADESVKVARDWVQKNAANAGAHPPKVTEGSVILQIK